MADELYVQHPTTGALWPVVVPEFSSRPALGFAMDEAQKLAAELRCDVLVTDRDAHPLVTMHKPKLES